VNFQSAHGAPSWWSELSGPGPRRAKASNLGDGREVIVLAVAVVITAAAIDTLLTDGLGLLFDLCFIATCLGAAMLVTEADFFAIGVLPPLLLLGVLAPLAVIAPGQVAEPDDQAIQAVVTGLAEHSLALATGYAFCLTTLAVRRHTGQGRWRQGGVTDLRASPGGRAAAPAAAQRSDFRQQS
jgi:hypothetical protein